MRESFLKTSKVWNKREAVSPHVVGFLYKHIPKAFNRLHNDFLLNGTALHNTRSLKIIPKPGKDMYLTMQSYRLISLINSITKLYETVLYNRLVTAVKSTPNFTMDDFVVGNQAY